MIDKTAYFFWQGEQMSWLRYMTLRSFVYHNPDWKAVLYLSGGANYTKTWTSPEEQEDYHETEYENYLPRVFDLDVEIISYNSESYHPAQNSDVACWDILSKNSGIFFDMDIVFIKSINNFWETVRNCDSILDITRYYGGNSYVVVPRVGLLASSGDNALFKDIHEFCKESHGNDYQSFGRWAAGSFLCPDHPSGVCASTIIHRLTNRYEQTIINIDLHDTIYVWDWYDDAPRFYDLHTGIEDSYFGIHWYGGRPVSQTLNKFLTESNFRQHKNTICHYAEKTY